MHQVLGIAEVICINSDRIVRTGPSQMNGAAALGAHSEDHGPAVGRWLEQHCILRRNVRPAARKGVEIGRVERCISLPKAYGLTSRHTRKPGVRTFPDTSKRHMIM